MAQSIISRISNSCSCSRKEAEEYLNGEIQHLRELKELDDLRFSDIVTACESLGLECVGIFHREHINQLLTF